MTIQIFFSFRFQSQLRRTRPKMVRTLEKAITGAIEGFGGQTRIEPRLISASFNGGNIGFWLDMLCMLETVKHALDQAASELYGHVCLAGRDIPEEDVPAMIRSLPSRIWGTGIWCAPEVRSALEPFMGFEEALEGDIPAAGYAQVKAIRELGEGAEKGERDNAEKIARYLKQGNVRNTVIVGAEHTGKGEGLCRYCSAQMKDFPLLVIRFNGVEGGQNMAASIGGSLTPELTAALAQGGDTAELERLGEVLFKERLRDELSEYIVKQGERFFFLLLKAYRAAADKRGLKPLLMLENIHGADPLSRLIITRIWLALPSRERIPVYSTCGSLEALEPWEELFPRIIKFTPEKTSELPWPGIPPALLEMAYCCRLFRHYFPPYLLPQLFREEGKNPAMIEKTLFMLSQLRIDGRPGFTAWAERTLGERTGEVRRVVRERLLAWVDGLKLRPCYRLLTILFALGGQGSDQLVLDAICADLVNGTFQGIEEAIQQGTFAAVAGNEREAALLFIVKTQRALNHGGRADILEAFKDPLPGGIHPVYSGFKARIYANAAAYYLGICDNAAAADAVKEAMLLIQNETGGRDLAQVYRLFSLVEFASHQLSDAIDYFAFAVENAEKSENYAELGISAYYAAAAHFILGNLSKARRLAGQARTAAIASVLPGWADRSRFLEGRICFETGRYQEALDLFKELQNSPAGPETEDFRQTLAAWVYRSGVYLHKTGVGHLGGLDAELFELEAAYLAGSYKKALELTRTLEKREWGERFIFIEQPDWRSGFCQCELILFPLKDLWDRMILTYRALVMCHMGGGEASGREGAVRDMQRAMREDVPGVDPNDAFYFYAYYQVLKRTGAPEVDMNTAVSIAFKRLQRRASRIDDNEVKRSFLSLHHWNSALAAAAREHKLI
ncbi:MAG: tetratricopeptide repeat protein [Treponema sp.]|jgi:tetratricopeptide (TPR) repeat protein|nr:tetratricopeptide repeat protein [Treponema sp.]